VGGEGLEEGIQFLGFPIRAHDEDLLGKANQQLFSQPLLAYLLRSQGTSISKPSRKGFAGPCICKVWRSLWPQQAH